MSKFNRSKILINLDDVSCITGKKKTSLSTELCKAEEDALFDGRLPVIRLQKKSRPLFSLSALEAILGEKITYNNEERVWETSKYDT